MVIKNKIRMTEFPIIKTNRLLLRQFIRSDVENVYKGLSHSDVIKYYGISFDSLEATEEQMNWFADLVRNKTGIWWAICSSDNTIFYGAGGLNSLSKEHKKAEIGFWLLPDFWGQGIMQEAFPLICNVGFKKLNLHRIEGFVDTENSNCIKSLKMLDFTHEGTMKECEIKNGKYISIDIYAKLNEK